MGDLRTFVKKNIRDVMKEEYPVMNKIHSRIAFVTSVQKQGDTNRYTVRLPEDNTELPNLISDQIYQRGDAVVIQFVAGIYPYIIGRWYE